MTENDLAVWHIEGMAKPVMTAEAERLLDGSGWLPEPLRNIVPQAESPEPDAPAPSMIAAE